MKRECTQNPTTKKKLPPQFSISLEEHELQKITDHAKKHLITRSQLVRDYTIKQINVSELNESIIGIEFTIKGVGFSFSKLISACGGFIDTHTKNTLSEIPSGDTGGEFCIRGTAADVMSVYELIVLIQAASQSTLFELNIKGEKNMQDNNHSTPPAPPSKTP